MGHFCPMSYDLKGLNTPSLRYTSRQNRQPQNVKFFNLKKSKRKKAQTTNQSTFNLGLCHFQTWFSNFIILLTRQSVAHTFLFIVFSFKFYLHNYTNYTIPGSTSCFTPYFLFSNGMKNIDACLSFFGLLTNFNLV